jgi:hypothetical protein
MLDSNFGPRDFAKHFFYVAWIPVHTSRKARAFYFKGWQFPSARKLRVCLHSHRYRWISRVYTERTSKASKLSKESSKFAPYSHSSRVEPDYGTLPSALQRVAQKYGAAAFLYNVRQLTRFEKSETRHVEYTYSKHG